MPTQSSVSLTFLLLPNLKKLEKLQNNDNS